MNNRVTGARAAAHLIECGARRLVSAGISCGEYKLLPRICMVKGRPSTTSGCLASATRQSRKLWRASEKKQKKSVDEMTSVAVTSRIMKNIPSLRIGLVVLAAFSLHIPGNLCGALVYEDDFSANPGALAGRTTATGFGNWTVSGLYNGGNTNVFQVGGGQITINTNAPVDYHAASFALPALTGSDILSLSITLRPSGPNFTGFGFNPNPATATGSSPFLTQSGYGWVYYEGLNGGNPNIQIFKGASTAGAIYFAFLNNPALNFDASLPTTFQYTYSAAAKTLSITATNGTSSSTLLNNADVSTIPLSAFSNFALQFQGQTLGTDLNPAFVDSLKVSVIPETSTFTCLALLLCVLGAMTALRRRRPLDPKP